MEREREEGPPLRSQTDLLSPAVPRAQPPVRRPRQLSWDHTALLAWAAPLKNHKVSSSRASLRDHASSRRKAPGRHTGSPLHSIRGLRRASQPGLPPTQVVAALRSSRSQCAPAALAAPPPPTPPPHSQLSISRPPPCPRHLGPRTSLSASLGRRRAGMSASLSRQPAPACTCGQAGRGNTRLKPCAAARKLQNVAGGADGGRVPYQRSRFANSRIE
jgi:hypothetical protein